MLSYMRVVSNISPISYLIVINQIDLLTQLFETIQIPEVVGSELASDTDGSAEYESVGKVGVRGNEFAGLV